MFTIRECDEGAKYIDGTDDDPPEWVAKRFYRNVVRDASGIPCMEEENGTQDVLSEWHVNVVGHMEAFVRLDKTIWFQ